MEEVLGWLVAYGYFLIFFNVLVDGLGLPVPAIPMLLAGGALCAGGQLKYSIVVVSAVTGYVVADVLLYVLGRKTGWTILGILCRVSLNPETCILKAADSFYRRGRLTLFLSKFLIGVGTMAPPLAGSLRMPAGQFVSIDVAGSTLFVLAFTGLGFLFRRQLTRVAESLAAANRLVLFLVAASVVAFVIYRLHAYWVSRQYRYVPTIDALELAERLEAGDIVVADVRSHGYYDKAARRIRGSIRIEPNLLDQSIEQLSRDKSLCLYCT